MRSFMKSLGDLPGNSAIYPENHGKVFLTRRHAIFRGQTVKRFAYRINLLYLGVNLSRRQPKKHFSYVQ